MKKEYKDGKVIIDYDTDNIKENCVMCTLPINASEKTYLSLGNYCYKCNARVSEIMRKKGTPTEEELNSTFR